MKTCHTWDEIHVFLILNIVPHETGPPFGMLMVIFCMKISITWGYIGCQPNASTNPKWNPHDAGGGQLNLKDDPIYIYNHTYTYTYTYTHTCIHTYITLHSLTLHCIALHYNTFHDITLHYMTLRYITYMRTYIYIYTYIHIHIHMYIHI